jgi:hypothetical protein
MDARQYIEKNCLRTPEDIDTFLKQDYHERYDVRGRGWTYDAECGWILVDSVRPDGVDNSNTFYHYEPTGCRRRINFPEKEARIHTYGNSFTHCDQVSDGETWQEYLAAHLQEPIENYGVGGYSVYQAYRRMLKVEKEHPAEYILLNIWDDDNFRNLDSWRTIRFGRRTSCGFTLPHLAVDLAGDAVEERDNLCPAPDDIHKMADLDWAVATFADDPVLRVVLASMEKGNRPTADTDVPVTFGLPVGDGAEELKAAHTRAALRATRFVLEKTEEFVKETGRKLLVVLSYSSGGIRQALTGEPLWDQELVDFLETRAYPYLDLRQPHLEEFQKFTLDVDTYLQRYYIGHYAPAGNFFFARALKNAFVDWLDPKPLPYRPYDEVSG